MTPVEVLEQAIVKLEALRAESQNWRVPVSADEDGPQVIHDFDTEGYGPGTGPLAWTTSDAAAASIVTLHRTIDAQLGWLRYALTLEATVQPPSDIRSHALALADAVLGGAQ